MRHITSFLLLVLLSYTSALDAQVCNPPEEVNAYVDEYLQNTTVLWQAPSSGCEVLYYELEFSSGAFTPGQGEGILVSPIDFPLYSTSETGYTHFWVRSVCDCDGDGGVGDGIPDSESMWVEAFVTIVPPPVFPDDGLFCNQAPEEPVELEQNCGLGGSGLEFISLFQWDNQLKIPCSGGSEYVLWRYFEAPPGGVVFISMDTYDSGQAWNDFGVSVYDACNGVNVFCQASFSDADQLTLNGLTPGQNYRIASWNNDFSYALGGSLGDYNGTLNDLSICAPDETCFAPSNLSTSQIQNHSAQISWSGNGGSQWIIEYGLAGFELGTGTVIENITATGYLLTGLESDTDYEFYVTADCGENGISSTTGPRAFSTDVSMWILDSLEDDFSFCCDFQLEDEVVESFGVGAYCDSVYYVLEDSLTGAGCNYQIHRTITAHDVCGNDISQSFIHSVIDNDIPCGCDGISEGVGGQGVAIDGDWAFISGIQENKMMKKAAGAWVEHQTDLPSGLANWVALDGDILVVRNHVYRLTNDEWLFETDLYSSAGDSTAFQADVQGDEVALHMGDNIVVFEHTGSTWTETGLFASSCNSLAFDGNMLVVTYAGDEDHIASVYVKNDGVWSYHQGIAPIDGGTGLGIGQGLAVDDGRMAIGHWYHGGIYTYTYDGTSWVPGQFMTNPFLYSPSLGGYGTAFGASIDIDGNLMVVGDNMNQTEGLFSGSVVVFEWLDDAWVPERNIVPTDGGSGTRFGGCVALSDENLLVGIERTTWLGGGTYFSNGEHWFIPCLVADAGFTIEAASGEQVECGAALPEPMYTLGPGWDTDFTVEIQETGEMSCGETIVRTIMVSDTDDNTAETSQTFTIIDTQSPVLVSDLADLSVNCGEEAELVTPVFEDACSPELTVVLEETLGSECIPSLIRTWTALDDCGNSSIATQTISYVDDVAPVLDCPDSLVVELSNGEGSYPMPDISTTIELSDACDPAPILTQSIVPGEQLGIGTYSLMITGVDACGNLSACELMLWVDQPNSLSELNLVDVNISPNPNDGEFRLSVQQSHSIEWIKMHDMTGREVFQQQVQGLAQIDVNLEVTPGPYILIAADKNGNTRAISKVLIR